MSRFILAKKIGFQRFVYVSDIFSNCVNYALDDSAVKIFSDKELKKHSKLINHLHLKYLKQSDF